MGYYEKKVIRRLKKNSKSSSYIGITICWFFLGHRAFVKNINIQFVVARPKS